MHYKTVLRNGMTIESESVMYGETFVYLIQVQGGLYNVVSIKEADILTTSAMCLSEEELKETVGRVLNEELKTTDADEITSTSEPEKVVDQSAKLQSETKAEAEFEKVIKEKFAVPDPNMYN